MWGAGNAACPGTHAEYVVVSSKEVRYFGSNFCLLHTISVSVVTSFNTFIVSVKFSYYSTEVDISYICDDIL